MEHEQASELAMSDGAADSTSWTRAIAVVSIALLVLACATAVWLRWYWRVHDVPTVVVSVGQRDDGKTLLGYSSVIRSPASSSSRTRLLEVGKGDSIWATWLELRTKSGDTCEISPAFKDGHLMLQIDTEFPVRVGIPAELLPMGEAAEKRFDPGEASLPIQLPKRSD